MKLFISVITTLFLLTEYVDIARAQTLINGANQAGSLLANTTNSYTFTASTGDSINVRLGSTFSGKLQLFGPGGVFLSTAQAGTDNLITDTATNSGTFTVLVSSTSAGTYVLNLSQITEAFIVPAGDGGGPMTNGGAYPGTITLARQDLWTFPANAGDSISVRLGTTNFYGRVQLFGPNGALLATTQGQSTDNLITDTATNSGTFTVLVSAYYSPGAGGGVDGTGTYVLSVAQAPESFIVSPGYQGGPMTNGGAYPGTIPIGDQEMWSFPANKGDSISVRLGTTGFYGRVQLFGPNGALLATTQGQNYDNLIAYTATNSGTFTVLVSAYYNPGAGGGVEGTGTYVLSVAQAPESFIVSPGYQGGPMTNGGAYPGTITLGDQQMWSFTANAGDSISVRLGTTGFYGRVQLFGPNGASLALVQGQSTDNLITDTATNSGTFTVLVSAYYNPGAGGGVDGTGTYVLSVAQAPESFIVSPGYQGGPMTNGGAYPGTIPIGDQEMWSFPANKGDSISVRLGTTGFYGRVQLFGPNGASLALVQGQSTDNLITDTATNSGTFTVLVSAYYNPGAGGGVEGTGTYVLSLAQAPESFIASPGYQGGPMTNGGAYPGTIPIGDQEMWSFPANKGDSISVRLGTTGFYGRVQLFGPNGASLALVQGQSTDNLITDTATNSGTFTVLVSAYYNPGAGGGVEGTGTYVLSLAQFPEPFIVPSGDSGGAMTGRASYAGTITLGDQDMFSFTACTGDSINLQLNTTNFDGWLQLFGSNGGLLKSGTGDGSTVSSIAYTATNCGTFTVLVSSWYSEGTGTYGLTANGLFYGFKTCNPLISGTSLNVSGVGGTPGINAVLFTTTNIASPVLWTPIRTNPFDQFGVFVYTNGFNAAESKRFFRLSHP